MIRKEGKKCNTRTLFLYWISSLVWNDISIVIQFRKEVIVKIFFSLFFTVFANSGDQNGNFLFTCEGMEINSIERSYHVDRERFDSIIETN